MGGEFEPGSPYKEDQAMPLDYKVLGKMINLTKVDLNNNFAIVIA